MKEINKIISAEKPKIIEYLGDGSYYYNYDIKSEDDSYSFIQVKLWGKANYSDCVKAIIRAFVTLEEEFDLINSVNKSILSESYDESVDKYQEYLELLDTIKANVKSDFYEKFS